MRDQIKCAVLFYHHPLLLFEKILEDFVNKMLNYLKSFDESYIKLYYDINILSYIKL